MNSLIEERDERTKRRKRAKRKMDSLIGLSYHDEDKHVMSLSVNVSKLSDKSIRLLDEGYIDNGFVIKKGTMEKYLNGQNQYVTGWAMNEDGEWERTPVLNLTSDFVGTVNLGHMDFATFPFIIGEWTKEDLTLVDIENDRKALDIDLHLDEESVFVKELKRQPYDIGVSAEFWYHVNEADTMALSEMLGEYMPVLDEIFIFAYGLVGECGNVNSSGLDLAKETEMSKIFDEIKENLEVHVLEPDAKEAEEAIEEASTEEPAELSDPVDEIEIHEEVNEAEETEEVEEEVADEEDGEEADIEEAVAEDADGDEDEERDETDALEQALETLNTMRAEIERLNNTVSELTETVSTLTEANAELKKTNRRLQNKLTSERDKKDKFLAEAKDIAVALFPNEEKQIEESKKEEADRKYLSGDGIGD